MFFGSGTSIYVRNNSHFHLTKQWTSKLQCSPIIYLYICAESKNKISGSPSRRKGFYEEFWWKIIDQNMVCISISVKMSIQLHYKLNGLSYTGHGVSVSSKIQINPWSVLFTSLLSRYRIFANQNVFNNKLCRVRTVGKTKRILVSRAGTEWLCRINLFIDASKLINGVQRRDSRNLSSTMTILVTSTHQFPFLW